MATFIVVPAKLHRNCASTSGTSIDRVADTAGAVVGDSVNPTLPGDSDMDFSVAIIARSTAIVIHPNRVM
jgi:hypothetical protein